MADYEDDPFGDAQFAAAPAAESEPLDLTGFEEAAAASFPPAEVDAIDNGLHDVVQMSTAESQAAFIGGYVPHPVESSPSFTAPPPENDNPRLQWSKKNQEVLAKMDEAEAAAKKDVHAKAKEHLAKFDAERKKMLAGRQKSNRDSQQASPEAGVPQGATWEKVNLLINFTQDKVHTKDLSRFKACLSTCKSLNVPVAVRAN